MMQNIRCSLVWVLLVAVTAATAVVGQTSAPLEEVCAISQDLTAYSAAIRMTQHQGGNISEIEFGFDFVPPNQMRILYTAPATVDGQTIILNNDKFYTYIPSLHRSVWQDVGEGGGNQGEEMGFLYDFVTRSVVETLEKSIVEIGEDHETITLECRDEDLEVYILTLSVDDERQVVLLDVIDAVPVAISIYNGDDLALEICVLDYEINGHVDETWFDIPEQ